MCTHSSLSQDGFCHKGLECQRTFDITPLWPPRRLSVHVWSGKSPDFENEQHEVWAGPSLLALIVLLFSSWSVG